LRLNGTGSRAARLCRVSKARNGRRLPSSRVRGPAARRPYLQKDGLRTDVIEAGRAAVVSGL